MKISVRALCLIAGLTSVASAQHTGDVAPALVWNKLKGNCPPSLDWASLRGQVVVVLLSSDAVFPEEVVEWNDFAQKFQGEHVFPIRVVGGSEFLLDQALRRTVYQGCVLFDIDHANAHNFDLPLFHRTVVVDKFGDIAGYSRGDQDEHGVRSVLNHQLDTGLLEVPPQPRPFDPTAGLDAAPSYEVHISPAKRGELRSLGVGGPDQYISKNQPLKAIILDLWSTPWARIAFPEKLDERNYDVTAHIPVGDHEQLLQVVRNAVERHFGLRVEKEERMQRVYILTVLPELSPQLQPATSDEEWMCGGGQGSIIGTAQSMQDIARAFEGLLEVPVVDGTGLKRKFNYSASSQLSESEAVFELARQLGLELTEAENPIEMLVVRKVR